MRAPAPCRALLQKGAGAFSQIERAQLAADSSPLRAACDSTWPPALWFLAISAKRRCGSSGTAARKMAHHEAWLPPCYDRGALGRQLVPRLAAAVRRSRLRFLASADCRGRHSGSCRGRWPSPVLASERTPRCCPATSALAPPRPIAPWSCKCRCAYVSPIGVL
jgi:hypothetical protein